MGYKKVTKEEMRTRLKTIHPSLSFPKIAEELEDTNSILTVVCSEHGEYTSSYGNLVHSKSGCKKCSSKRTNLKNLKRIVEIPWVKEFSSKYPMKDSTTVGYSSQKLPFICDKHGEFLLSPKEIKRGYGCYRCGREKLADKQRKPISNFLEEMSSRGLKVSIEGEFLGAKHRVIAKCDKGHEWGSFAYNLTTGHGCPKCSNIISSQEVGLSEFISGIVPIETQKRIKNKVIDVFVPSKDLCIEYNGSYFHSSKFLPRKAHYERRLLLEKEGYRVVFIWEHEWVNNRAKVELYLRSLLTPTNIIYARKCEVKEVEVSIGNKFIDYHHLQGVGLGNCHYLGLYHSGILVGCVGFRKVYNQYELYRAAYLEGYRVVGGLSKVVSHWSKHNPGTDLISYIDRDKFDGASYFKSGFVLDKTSISMNYVKRGVLINRHKLRKNKLVELPNYSEHKTEKEILEENNIFQIYNSGTDRVVLKKSHIPLSVD